MNICVVSTKGSLDGTADRMAFEGDHVTILRRVTGKEDFSMYDLILTDKRIPRTSCPVVGGDEIVPSQITRTIFPELPYGPQEEEPFFFLCKWFDSYAGFSPQTVILLPVYGTMNSDLGKNACTGIGLRYIEPSPREFENPMLRSVLSAMGHNGFVSIGFNANGTLTKLLTFLPHKANEAVLEGVDGKISGFYAQPYALHQSWVVGVLVTVYPFPFSSKATNRVFFSTGDPQRKHFFFHEVVHTGKSSYTDSSIIGLSTAYGLQLNSANRRALNTCYALEIPEIQFRTDISTSVSKRLAHVRSLRESEQSFQYADGPLSHETET